MMRLIILLISAVNAMATAYTSSQSGPWSSASTWGGSGVPGSGDTASIGAHTVNVDVNTTVGTSPNNNTTTAINITSGSGVLVVTNGVTLTVKGNIGHTHACTHTQRAGSTVTFDNSGSGGSPVYTFINGGFSNFNFLGSAGNIATLQAISGQTFAINVAWSIFNATFAKFFRCSNATISSINGNITVSDSTFDTCSQVNLTTTSGTIAMTFDRNSWTNGTGANDLVIAKTTYTSGTVRVSQNRFSKLFTYSAKAFAITSNYFGGGIEPVVSSTTSPFRLNFIRSDGTPNSGNGQLLPFPVERNYWVVETTNGNPHFLAPTALQSVDNTVSQNIFESQCPDVSDLGDAIILRFGATSGGFKVLSKNNLLLPAGYTGTSVASGTLLTVIGNTTSAGIFESYRSTASVNTSTIGGVGARGMFAVGEGSSGQVGQVSALKANLAWGSSANQGYLGENVNNANSNATNVITATGADYNWVYNTSTGNNLRSYNNRTTTNQMWNAGFAVAAGVDAHQGSGDPAFYDSARNAAKWCSDRGYGTQTYTNALSVIQADPSKVPDLIAYVFEGFRPSNSSCRTSYDGAPVGAANYWKTTRTTGLVSSYRAGLSVFGL